MSGAEREVALAREYDAARSRLVGVAYALLGSWSEAEDVVADTWLKLAEADGRSPVRDVLGWSTVATARTALDVLRSARVRRESYVGPWLPEPVVTGWQDPADQVSLDDSVRYALLVVLERLTPAERTAWVLHDLFGLPFGEIATIVGRSPAAVRQLASRARSHVAAAAPRVEVEPSRHEAVVAAFARAAVGGDLTALVETLDPEVVLTSDGGGEVSSARRPVAGADRVARFILGIAARHGGAVEPVTVNGLTGLMVLESETVSSIVALTVSGGRVSRVDMIRAPAKLARMARTARPRDPQSSQL